MNVKSLCLFVSTLFVVFNAFSCGILDRGSNSHFYSRVSDEIALEICVSYSVPGISQHDFKGSSGIEILEQDSYGRTLYKHVGYSYITDRIEKVVVVCQKIENGFVYFYEDKNYLLYDYTEMDLLQLKERNDWNNPFSLDKMTCGKILVSFDLVNLAKGEIDFKDRESWLLEQLGAENDFLDSMIYESSDTKGKESYTVLTKNGDNHRAFYIICSPEYDVVFLKADETTEEEDFSNFKKECGWNYANE